MIYKIAEKDDIKRLINFRWERAYEHGDFLRKDMKAFKTDFRFTLNQDLNKSIRCYYVEEDEKILGTIYWIVAKRFIVSSETSAFDEASIKYFEGVKELPSEVYEHLLEKVLAVCKEEGIHEICSFYREEDAKILMKYGFSKDGDILKLAME